MGMIAAHMALFTGPGAGLLVLLRVRAERPLGWRGWLLAVGTAAATVAVRVWLLLGPYLPTGKAPVWPVLFSLLVSRPLFWSWAGAGILLVLCRLVPRTGRPASALLAGLLLSFPFQLLLAVGGFRPLLALLGLRPVY